MIKKLAGLCVALFLLSACGESPLSSAMQSWAGSTAGEPLHQATLTTGPEKGYPQFPVPESYYKRSATASELVHQKRELLKVVWACHFNCPAKILVRFSDGGALQGDLGAKVNWGGAPYEFGTWLHAGQTFEMKGAGSMACNMVTDNYFHCRLYNQHTGIYETLGFKPS